MQHLGKKGWHVLKTLACQDDPAISHLGVRPKEWRADTQTIRTPISITALLTTVKGQRQPSVYQPDEWVNKTSFLHTRQQSQP